jgi:uncharacterized secreted protein with C-terminal beta-propeller domain
MSDQVNTNIMPKNYYPSNTLTIKLYDISNKEDLKLVKSIDYQGNYITARMIDNYAYFVFNNRPNYSVIKETNNCKEIIPLYRETTDNNSEFMPITKCTDIGYVESINADNFITVASIKLENGNTQSETILGRGQNIYSSLKNLYVVQTVSSNNRSIGLPVQKYIPETIITKFNLNQGNINFSAIGNVKGIILNQFSMDEYNDNFRIATTISGYDNENNIDISTNNMYILDKDLKLTGKIEDIAKGESIYSVRFMGKKAYMVTFKHIDPLFVIDLEDPTNPKILGKLKIPGYSDYLHPYDENYLIGIGKEVDASIDADKIHTEGAVYYTAIQGVKLAIFDVSNVSNPIEIHKEVIGDRGTESIATKDHKSFLFDKQKNLLIIPMIVAELNNGQNKSQQGNYTFSGAYVYNLDLENGFNLRGRVTHYDSNEPFEKAGYYFRGNNDIKRSLYIKDVLYTFSNNRLQLNNLNTLELLKKIELN